MADVEFYDFRIQCKEALDDAAIKYLYEAAGELQGQTIRNSRPFKKGKKEHDVRGNWKYKVDEDDKEAVVGNPLEASYWEELGTGEYALNKDGREGWWVYVEGQDSKGGGKTYSSKEEAEETVAYLREKGLDAHATKGTKANRPLFRAYTSSKSVLIRMAEQVFKGLN